MQPLELELINHIAPYSVWCKGDFYFFDTEYGVQLRLDFDDQGNSLSEEAYWFNIVNLNGISSPHDEKVMPTIWAVIEEFFRKNPKVLLYMCDSANDQQAMRARLFKRWFNLYEGNGRFIFRQVEIPEENIVNYVSMILPKSHPMAQEIVDEFEEQAEMFKANKPH